MVSWLCLATRSCPSSLKIDLVARAVEAMIFMISEALAPDVGTIFSHAVNISMTRRAYKLLAVLIKSDSEAGVS